MKVGDFVVRKSYGKDITFRIIDIKESENGIYYILKGINIRIIADAKIDDLVAVDDGFTGEKDRIFNTRVNERIRKVMVDRDLKVGRNNKGKKIIPDKELTFGRPGKILHVDGDPYYLDACVKVYKQLNLNIVGKSLNEREQPNQIVDLVKNIKPDIVVLTGHDGLLKNAKDYLNLNNYRNSKYFIEAVQNLRNYNSSYDELVIFAGACQSCYESILDAGANYASSPNRVLIHCLDPVFVCEKVAYTRIDTVVAITDVIENTITGIKGIGGLQTRGKYREGYPKSPFVV